MSEEEEELQNAVEVLNSYKNYHLEFPWQAGIGKIYDPYLIEAEKNKDYFAKEYELKSSGVGNRVFGKDLVEKCLALGSQQYDPVTTFDPYTEKYMGMDPGFQGSHFGIVVVDVFDGNLRVLFAEDFHRKDTQIMIDKILDLRIKYRNIKNILIDASQSEFIMDLKMYFDNTGYEYPDSYNEKIREWDRVMNKEPWQMGMYVVPVPFNKRVEYTQRLKKMMEYGNYLLHPSFDKLITAYETSVSKNLDVNEVDKDHQQNSDIFDAMLCIMRRLKPV